MKKIVYIITIFASIFLIGCFDKNKKLTKDDIHDGNKIQLTGLNNNKKITLVRYGKGFYIQGKKDKILIISVIDAQNQISTLDIPQLEKIREKYKDKVEIISFLINYKTDDNKITEVPNGIELFNSKYANAILELILDDNDYNENIIKLPLKTILQNGHYTTLSTNGDYIYFGRIYLEYLYTHINKLLGIKDDV